MDDNLFEIDKNGGFVKLLLDIYLNYSSPQEKLISINLLVSVLLDQIKMGDIFLPQFN